MKNISDGDSDLPTAPVQHQADETSVNHRSNRDEITRRPYEIYHERGGLPGNELDDWFLA
jgi:hypothetical protein